MDLMQATTHRLTGPRRHVVANPFIDDDDAARPRLTSYLALFGTENGESRLLCTGTYRDEACLEKGRWVLARRPLCLDAPLSDSAPPGSNELRNGVFHKRCDLQTPCSTNSGPADPATVLAAKAARTLRGEHEADTASALIEHDVRNCNPPR